MSLSLKQNQALIESDARFNIWVGAVRSGKTYSSILKLIHLIQHGPPGHCMIIGVSRDTIQRNVLAEMYQLLNFPIPGSKTMETKLYGRNIYFVGANDEGAVRKIQGSTLAIAYVDEATCIPQPFWRMLQSRLSVKGAQLLCTCNPEGPAHWLKKDFIDRSNELDLKYWTFTLDDNPSLDPKYIEDLKKEYTGSWYKRYILGEWAVAQGVIYPDFDNDNIYDEPYDPPSFYVAALDYGTTNPTACLLGAITPTKWPQIRIEKEYYFDQAKHGRSKTDSELADDIYDFLSNYNIRSFYVDPAAASIKIELRNRNIPVLDANNDVLTGIRFVSKFIANKNIIVHRSCKNLIEEIKTYQWDPKAADRGIDKPIKVSDHCADGLRYLCASTFPDGNIHHINNDISIEEARRQVYGDQPYFMPEQAMSGGYF